MKRHSIPRGYYREARDPNTPAARLSELNQREHSVVLRRSLAMNPNAPGRLLRQLLYPRDDKTWRHLAQNPSSPGEVLQRAGDIFPEALWQNPVLPLLLLEQPSFLGSLYRRLLLADNAPVTFLASAARHANPTVRQAAAKNPATPSALLAELSTDEDKGVRNAATQNASLIPNEESRWVQQVQERESLSTEDKARLSQGNTYLRTLLAAHPATTEEELQRLSKDQSKRVVRAVFTRGDTPDELLAYAAESQTWRLTLIAAHPKTPAATLRELYRAPISFRAPIVDALWKNPNTPEELLDEMLDVTEKSRISQSDHLTRETLLRMLQSPNLNTRLEASRNPNIPQWIKRFLYRLGYSAYKEGLHPTQPVTSREELGMMYLLREHLSQLIEVNPQLSQVSYRELPLRTAQRLLHHPSAELRLAATQEPTMPKEALNALYQIGAIQDLSGAIEHPTPADEELLQRLSKGGYFARWLVAQNPATPEKILRKLVLAEPKIAALALCHINTSEETLLRVAQQKNKPLHLAMLQRGTLPESVLWWLLSSEHHEVRQRASWRIEAQGLVASFRSAGADAQLRGFKDIERGTSLQLLERLANLGPYGQQLAARHPDTPTLYLTRFAACLRPSLRLLAAKNPSTPQETLALLRKLGASEDLIEIEVADDCTEAERAEATGLGLFGGLLARLAC